MPQLKFDKEGFLKPQKSNHDLKHKEELPEGLFSDIILHDQGKELSLQKLIISLRKNSKQFISLPSSLLPIIEKYVGYCPYILWR